MFFFFFAIINFLSRVVMYLHLLFIRDFKLNQRYGQGKTKSETSLSRSSLSKKCKYVRYYARASQSSVVRGRRKKVKSVFSGDMCVGKNTAQPASVRAKRVRRSGLQPFEHVLARAREPVDFVDRLERDILVSLLLHFLNCSELTQRPISQRHSPLL